MSQILIPYDFSPHARRALALAMQGFPYDGEALLKIVHVIDEHLYKNVLSKSHIPNEDAVVAYLKDDVARVKAGLTASKIKVEPVYYVVRGRPHEELLKAAGDLKPLAIFMGGQGHGGLKERFVGRTAQRVIREAACPVYLVKDPADRRGVPRRILCAVDYSDTSKKALAEVARLCRSSGAALSLIHVIENPYIPYLERVAAEIHDEATLRKMREENLSELLAFEKGALGKPQADTHHAVFGPPVDTIVQHARILTAGVIAIGTHGHSAPVRLFLGATAEGVAVHSPIDVLVIR